jgi:hypothetical protein
MINNYVITSWCIIRKDYVLLNDKSEPVQENNRNFADLIKSLFKKEQISYPKFYKMDNLSKLGFLCAELVLRNSRVADRYSGVETGIVIFNAASSLDTDLTYQDTIRDRANYFPSPSIFVYTLPNIVIGEICIRHKINGENAFLVTERFDAERIKSQADELLDHGRASACLCGWVDILKDRFEALLFFVEKPEKTVDAGEEKLNTNAFTVECLNEIYNKQG